MIKRPSPDDTEEDIIQMQADFLQEKFKNADFQPAAKVVKPNPTTARKVSKFAERRAQEKLEKGQGPAAEQQQEDSATDSNVYRPIIGEIRERQSADNHRLVQSVRSAAESDQGFPKPERLNRSQLRESSGKSLFAMSRAAQSSAEPTETETPSSSSSSSLTQQIVARDFGEKSFILSNDPNGQKIHEENVRQLQQMNESDLQDQRKQLMESMDPDLIKFIRSRRTAPPAKPAIEEEPQSPESDDSMTEVANVSTLDILHDPNYENWPNFDIVEPAKLQWMRDVNQKLPAVKPGETFEARFDWKGVLLPYATLDGGKSGGDERELYLHGDDAQRPGYTLQELFRLARSNVVQQRIAALSSIAGLLSIHQQGFYDTVLDVPVSKIFFLLRFAFDDNHVPAILEVTARALAALFHNDADEVLLDFMRDCSPKFHEPVLTVDSKPVSPLQTDSEDEDDDGLEAKFAQIELEKRAAKFSTNVDEDDEESPSRDTLNDFHLAEIDLIDCFRRTNVVQRINYILFTIRPPNSTIGNCLKLLIRLARSGLAVAQTLLDNDLLANVITVFLAKADERNYYARPQHLAMKLVRIVASYGRQWCTRLGQMGAVDALKKYIFVQNEVTVGVIKLQIEAFRLAKVMVISDLRGTLYSELTPALLYMLEWSYQFMKFELPAHLLFRQHATALVTLIGSTGPTQCSERFTEKLQLSCSKWFHQATQHGVAELSQNILLAACLNACARLSGDGYHEFYAKYLSGLLRSKHYAMMCADLSKQSPLLRKLALRTNQHPALPHLSSVVVGTARQLPEFLVTQKYSVCLLTSILNLLHTLHLGQHRKLFADLFALFWTPDLVNYLDQIANQPLNDALRRNWFLRTEITFLVDLLRSAEVRDHRLDKIVVQRIAYRMSTYLTEDQMEPVLFLFNAVVFESSLYAQSIGQTQYVMQLWKRIYQHICFAGVQAIDPDGLMVTNHGRLVLAAEWPYQPVLNVLRSVTEQNMGTPFLHERDLLRACLTFTSLQKINDLEYLSPTEELIFLMISHLGPDATFLEPDINAMLAERVRVFFIGNKKTIFKLDEPHNGAITFENLFLLFVDHFEGTSYGDLTFGALLMVPLAQKYDLRWRRLVWSEHVSALRFMQCTEQQLIGGLDDYLYPVETDVAMLKYYYQAINSVPFAENSVARRIAEHHLRLNREMKMELKASREQGRANE